jgi:hypothetical protein
MDPTIDQDPVRAFAEPPLVDDAAAPLAAAALHAIAGLPVGVDFVLVDLWKDLHVPAWKPSKLPTDAATPQGQREVAGA